MAVQQKIKHKCPPHHFIINSENVGHCRDCPEVRDFGKLLGREGFGLRSKSKNGGTRGKRGKGQATIAKIPVSARKSTAAKERWENPEYRAKQGAAMKAAWQDPEYRTKQNAAHASLPGRHHKKEILV